MMKMLRQTLAWTMSLTTGVAAQTLVERFVSTTSSAALTTHTVSVGAEPFKFTPNNFNASVGDIIEFSFYPQNHSIARAEYGYPCIPYEVTGPGKMGFWSGFEPLSIVLPNPPTFRIKINDTNPLFYYCGAPGACNHNGMVGAINANSTQSFDNQLAMAKNTSLAFVPGESFPVEGGSSSTLQSTPTPSATDSTSPTPSATDLTSPTPTPTLPTAQATSASAAASPDQPPSEFSTGAIVGISLGATAIAIIVAALFYFCGRQRTLGEFMRRPQDPGPAPYVPYAPYAPYHGPSYGSRSPPFPESLHHKVPSVDVSGPTGPQHQDLGIRGIGGVGDVRYHDHSPANESSSYRSRSPPVNERTESVSPLFSPRSNRPERSDWPRREVGAGHPNETRYNPIMGHDVVSPTSINDQDRDIPSPLRHPVPQRVLSAGPGPHELEGSHEEEEQRPPPRPFSFTTNGDERL